MQQLLITASIILLLFTYFCRYYRISVIHFLTDLGTFVQVGGRSRLGLGAAVITAFYPLAICAHWSGSTPHKCPQIFTRSREKTLFFHLFQRRHTFAYKKSGSPRDASHTIFFCLSINSGTMDNKQNFKRVLERKVYKTWIYFLTIVTREAYPNIKSRF